MYRISQWHTSCFDPFRFSRQSDWGIKVVNPHFLLPKRIKTVSVWNKMYMKSFGEIKRSLKCSDDRGN
jgi:hypothetical protein